MMIKVLEGQTPQLTMIQMLVLIATAAAIATTQQILSKAPSQQEIFYVHHKFIN
jgi:hypothetical protein